MAIEQSDLDAFVNRIEAVMSDCGYESVQDILADIRHYCDKHGLDYGELDGIAYRNYIEEQVAS